MRGRRERGGSEGTGNREREREEARGGGSGEGGWEGVMEGAEGSEMEEGAGREGRREEGRGRDSLPAPSPSPPSLSCASFGTQILAATIFSFLPLPGSSYLSLDLYTSPWILLSGPGSSAPKIVAARIC